MTLAKGDLRGIAKEMTVLAHHLRMWRSPELRFHRNSWVSHLQLGNSSLYRTAAISDDCTCDEPQPGVLD